MADVFISYAGEDRERAGKLADALEAHGWSVWWDREIPFGKPFDQVIEEELNAAHCIVVLWSKKSVRSRWVKTEAAAAADRDRLVPVLIDEIPLPLEFKRIQTAMLQGWAGDRTHPEFARLIDSIREMLGQPAAPQPARPERDKRASGIAWSWRTKSALATGVIVLALIGVLVAKKHSTSTEPITYQPAIDAPRVSSQAPGSGGSSTSAASSRSSAPEAVPTSTSAAAVKGAFPIKIGDRIEDGVPARGAGNIESPGATDVYTFAAAAGQRLYFRVIEQKDLYNIRWTLSDPDGAQVFDTKLGYGDPGIHVLKKPGGYTMTVGSDSNPETGTYRLQIYNVPAARPLPLKIGETIKENSPQLVAGVIETPGANNIYTFTASAGQQVYFRMVEQKDLYNIKWTLSDPDGAQVFDTKLGYGDPGIRVLKKPGTYTMTVGSNDNPETGAYRLQLLNVPPSQRFAIKVGDMIKDGSPSAGAGNIETPGAKDVYTFRAGAGERVYFRMFEQRDLYNIQWVVTDPDGTQVFDTKLGYGDPGAHILKTAGLYTMTIGSDTNPGTGTYRLQITSAPTGR